MSVATKSYVSSYANNQHTDEMAQRPRSPPPNFMSSSSRVNVPHASQESNLKRPSPAGDEDEHRSKRVKTEQEVDRMDTDSSQLPTNHDRKDGSNQPGGINGHSMLDVQHQSDQVTSSAPVNQQSEPAFLLCRNSVPPSRVDANKHLLAMYGLGDLLRSVARTDPFTGDKINKLRKSYEGQIKTFGLPGRNRAEKADRADDEPGPLRALARMPDQKWDSEQGKNSIAISPDFQEKLKSALQIQPGKVRNNAEWEDVLGHEKPRINLPPQQQNTVNRIPNGPARPNLSSLSADKRSTRGKKRSYGDESFVGYGEGYSDMDDDGDDPDDFARRKRKKDSFGQAGR